MKTFFAITVPLAIIAVAVASGAAGQTAQPRPQLAGIGYINAQRVLAEANSARADVARAQALQRQKAAELLAKQKTLEETRQKLAQASDPAARIQLQQEELQQRTDLERASAQAQVEIQAIQRQVQGDLLTKVRPVVEAVAKERNLDLVLNADTSVVWAAGGMDLTNAVIERLNANPNASRP